MLFQSYWSSPPHSDSNAGWDFHLWWKWGQGVVTYYRCARKWRSMHCFTKNPCPFGTLMPYPYMKITPSRIDTEYVKCLYKCWQMWGSRDTLSSTGTAQVVSKQLCGSDERILISKNIIHPTTWVSTQQSALIRRIASKYPGESKNSRSESEKYELNTLFWRLLKLYSWDKKQLGHNSLYRGCG